MDATAFFANKPLVGMVHLEPLPGSARFAGDFSAVVRRAVEDARALQDGGLDGVMVENFFDSPFHKTAVPPHTVAAMTTAVHAVRESISIPVGVNVLRNDVRSALAIAHVTGARFVRCNVYVGAVVTDQGIIEGAAREAVEYRRYLGADVWILADIGVKHAWDLDQRSLSAQAQEAAERGLADALIVTGSATGAAPDDRAAREVKESVPHTPVLIGSGLNQTNARNLLQHADGAIVGSSLKQDGELSARVDLARVRALVRAVKRRQGD